MDFKKFKRNHYLKRRWKILLSEVTFTVGQEELPVRIIYSKRRTISLEIKAEGTINARVPDFIPDADIKKLIEDNKLKLYRKYKEFCPEGKKTITKGGSYDKLYYNGAVLPFVLGEIKLLLVKKGSKDSAKLYYRKHPDGSRSLTVETGSEDSVLIRDSITDWYRRYAKETLLKKTAYYSKIMQTDYQRITVREQRTRWGSCSSKGNLNFNWKLMMMPETVIDYVVVHELAHRKHMDHSPAFWREVEKILPDYKDRRYWLRENGRNFSFY